MTSRKASILGLLCLLLLHSQPTANAQYVSDGGIPGGEASGTLYSAIVPLAFPRSFLFARGDFGDRPGVEDSYFEFGGFMPAQFHGPDEVFYLEGSAWITEDDSSSVTGGTFGIGNRWMIRDFSQVVGINAFAAWDQSNTGNTYDGAGVGVEWFSDYLGVTANAYIPWNNDRINTLGPVRGDKNSAFFTGSNLAFQAFQQVEEQTAGVDIEVGSAIPRAEFLSAYVGGYYFDAEEGNEFSGVSGRIQMDMTNAIVNVTVSNDDRFGTTVNVGGEIRLGDGPLNFAPRSRNLDRQFFDRARRRSRIATTTYDAQTMVIATRPDDGSPNAGLPFEFLHVDNTAVPGGDGSFDNRFDELNDASNMPAADIILVYRGDTTFGGTHLDANGGLFLEDGQIVIGEGYQGFTIETAQFPGLDCPLPGFGDGGTNPFIDGNANANIINLANNNRILGLNLLPSESAQLNTGNAIFGNGITISSTEDVPFIDQINSDLATDAMTPMPITGTGGGIRLENASGVAFITDSGFNIDSTVSSGGVVVDNEDTDDLEITISNNLTAFPRLVYSGGTAGVSISGDNSNITAELNNIINTGSVNGLVQNSMGGGNVDLEVNESSFTDAIADNFNAVIDGGTGSAEITNTSLAMAGDDAIDIFADDGATFTLELEGSSGDDATTNGILALIQGGSDVTLTAMDSTFDRALNGSGIDVTVMGASMFEGEITNGSFDDAGANAVALDVQGTGSNGMLTLDNTSGQRAGEDAININATDASALTNAIATLVLTDSTDFQMATNDGLQITNMGATVNVSANASPNTAVDFSNFVNGNGLNSVSTGAGAITDINFTDGANFDQTGMAIVSGDAIFIQSDTGANTMLTGSAISGNNAGDDAIDLNSDGGIISVDISAAGLFTEAGQNDATGDGIDIFNDNGGSILLDLDGAANGIVDFSGAAQNGLLSVSQDTMGVGGTSTTVNFNDGGDLSDAGLDAIGITSVAGADTNVTGQNMVGTMAGSDAIELAASGTGSMIDIDFTGTNDFSDALNNGIVSINTLGGNIDVNIGNANFSETVAMSGRLTGDGLASGANGVGTSSTFTFDTGAMFNNAGIAAIFLDTSDGASNTVRGANLSGTMAGADAIEIVNAGAADSTTTINLTGTNDFSNATNNGINSMNTAGDVIVSIGNADFSGNGVTSLGGSGITSTATGATADSMFTFNTGANFDDAGVNAIMLDSNAGGTNTLTGNMVSGARAGADAINLNADGMGSDIDLTLTNSTDFTESGDDGLEFTATAGANIDISLAGTVGTPINFDDLDGAESGFGVNGNVTGSTASLTLNNASFDETALGGLQVNAMNSTFNANIMNTTFNDSLGTGVEFNLNNVTGNPIVLNNVDAMNAGVGNPSLADDENALTINIMGGGSNVFNIDDFDGSNAFNNGFEMNVTGASTLTFDLDDSNFSMAGRNAAEWNASGASIVLGAILNNNDLSGAGQQGAAVTVMDDGDALQINSFGGSRFGVAPGMGMMITSNIKIDNSDLSGAADNAMDFMLDMASEVNVHVDPTDLTGAGSNGVEFDVLGGSTLNLQITDNSDISTSAVPVGENGIFGIIDGASTVNLLVQDSDIANDGDLAGDFDAINITADDGSTLNLGLNNVDMSGWSDAGMTMGDGLVLNLEDSNANVMISGTGTDISIAGNNAIEINANSGASANQTGSIVNLDLGEDGLSLDGAGNTGLVLNSNGPDSLINVDGDDVTASGTGNLGFDIQATGGGDISLMGADNLGLTGWIADGNAVGGLNILADGIDSNVFGRFNGLNTINAGAINPGMPPVQDGSFGIQIQALNGAEIGDRSIGLIGTAGLIFNDTVSGNFNAPNGTPDFGNLTQDHALLVNTDNGAFAGLIFNDSQFDANEERGVIINSNSNAVVDEEDTALVNILFNGGTINNNGGDGVLLISDEANIDSNLDPMNLAQSGGINARFSEIDIRLNSNAFMQPVLPGMVPAPEIVDGGDADDNGWGVFVRADDNMPLGGPGLVNLTFNMTDLSDNEEGDIGDNGGTIINMNLNNMNLNMPIQICADAGDVTRVFNDVTISGLMGNQAAISILADNGFTADVTFINTTIEDVEAQAVAMLAQNDSAIIANFNGLMIDNAGYGMPGVTTDDPTKTGLALEGVIQGSVLDTSSMEVNLSGVTIDNEDGMTDAMVATTIGVNAVDFEVDGAGATLDLNIAPGGALGGLTVLGGATTAGNVGGVDMLEGEIDVELTLGGQATINLGDINIADSDSLGINLTDDGTAGGGFIIEGLDDIQATGAAQTGFNLVGNLIDNGMALTPTEVSLTNSDFSNAGQGMNAADGVNIDVNATGDTDFTFTNVTANTVGNGTATDDGLALEVDGLGALANSTIEIDGSSFNGASGGDGIRIDLDGAATLTADITITDTTATGAGDDGLFITGNSNIDITAITLGDAMGMMNDVDFSGAGGDGVQVDLQNQLNATDIVISNLTANNSGGGGVDLNLDSIGGDSTVSLGNVEATGSQGGDGLNVLANLQTNANIDITIGNGSDFSMSSMNGVLIDVNGDLTNTIDLSVDGVTSSGNTGGDGFNFAVDNGQTVNINDFANLTTNGNSEDGIDLSFDNGTTVNIDPLMTGGTFTGITSMQNVANGLLINVLNGSTVNPVTIDGMNLSQNSAASTTEAGLQINVENGSTADFTFNDLVIDNTGFANFGRGVALSVQGGGMGESTLDFTMGGTSTITNTGREGVDIEAGTMAAGGNFNGDFSGLTITNSGTAPLVNNINGFDLDAQGAGTDVVLTLDQTSSVDNFVGDGFNLLVDSAATLDATLTEVVGSNNGQSGLDVFASGANTDLNLTLMTPMGGQANTFSDNGFLAGNGANVMNDGGHGVEVRLEQTATATLQLAATTNGNAGDGIRVTTDDSGVTIDDLGITADSIMVDNNGGNGLTIDLDTVVGVNTIDLTGINVNNNAGDQISITLTDMDTLGGPGEAINSLLLNDVIVNGLGAGVGTGNGITINLDNSDILMDLGLNNIQATNNGMDGLRLALMNGSTIPAGSAIDTTVSGMNQDAMFDNNGRHGISILLDDSMAELDILNSRAMFARDSSMSNNGASGIDIVLRNTSDLDTNIDGHMISGNGDIGVNVQLFEQSTMDLAFGATGMNGQNVINNNVYAGIGLELYGTSVLNSFTVENTSVTNTRQGADSAQLALGYTGDGLRVITNASNDLNTDTRIINPVIGGADPMAPNTEFSNNVGRGLVFEANLDSRMTSPIIRNSLINDNGESGIRFERLSNSLLDDVMITGNQINDNGGTNDAGINIILQGGALDISNNMPLTIDFLIADNEINDSGDRGINFELNADVVVDADILDNTIFNSAQEGIRLIGEDDSVFDGMWMDNFIRNSGSVATADGIFISAMDRALIGTNSGLFIADSEISGSSGDGIEVNTSGATGGVPQVLVNIMDNQQQNVNDTRGIFMNDGNGINLSSNSSTIIAALVDRNEIANNGVDGIAATRSDTSLLSLMADENLIQANSQHGVNLNASGVDGNATLSANLSVNLTDNEIVLNARRGVSLVNSGDSDSSLTIDGTVDPTPNGVGATSRIEQNGEIGVYVENNTNALNTTNDIEFNLSDTSIVGNGSNVNVSDDDRNGVWVRVGTSTLGVVVADVQRNYFSGNGTIDFVTQSFTSAPDPTTDNPYDNNQIANTNTYDPLARLALNLVDNVGDTIDVTRFGAFYNNADEYKSPNALFDSESRRRNAQRTAVDYQDALTSDSRFVELAPDGNVGPFVIMGTVDTGPPNPAAGSFQASGGITSGLPNNDLEGLGINISGVRYITAYNANNRQVTFTPALGGAPAVGTPFTVFARNISGVGSSTFRTAQSTVNSANNFANVISDFDDAVLLNPGVSDASPLFGNPQTFTWDNNNADAAIPMYVFP